MSTKIYHAYRVPRSRLNDFIDSVREQMLDAVTAHVQGLMPFVALPEDWDAGVCGDAERKRIEQYRRFEQVMKRAVEAAQSSHRDLAFDLECGLNIWLNGRYAYVMPIGEQWILNQVKSPADWAIDYSYWNNVDPPEEVPSREWGRRSKAWDRICTGEGAASHNARRLYHAVVDLKMSPSQSTYDLHLRVMKQSTASTTKQGREVADKTPRNFEPCQFPGCRAMSGKVNADYCREHRRQIAQWEKEDAENSARHGKR